MLHLLVVAAVIAMSPQNSPAAPADDTTTVVVDDVYAREVGDDNADGVIMEDESGWDCATMGNMICGPGAVDSAGDLTYCPQDGVWSREWHSCGASPSQPSRIATLPVQARSRCIGASRASLGRSSP